MNTLNISLFNLINNYAGTNHFLDILGIIFARYLIFLFPVYIVYMWIRERKKKALFMLTSILFSVIVTSIIKIVYVHPRPFMAGIGSLLIPPLYDSSFPSTHTSIAFAAAFSLFFLKDYLEGAVFTALSFIVGLARVFSGVHFPFDIIGGIAAASVSAYSVWLLRGKLDGLFKAIIESFGKVLKI